MERLVALVVLLVFVNVSHSSPATIAYGIVDDGWSIGVGSITGGEFGANSFNIGVNGSSRPGQKPVVNTYEDYGDGGVFISANKRPQHGSSVYPSSSQTGHGQGGHGGNIGNIYIGSVTGGKFKPGSFQTPNKNPNVPTKQEIIDKVHEAVYNKIPNKEDIINKVNQAINGAINNQNYNALYGSTHEDSTKPVASHVSHGQGGQAGQVGTVVVPNKGNQNLVISDASQLDSVNINSETGGFYIDSITGGHFKPGSFQVPFKKPNVPIKNFGTNNYPRPSDAQGYVNSQSNSGHNYGSFDDEKPWIWDS